MNAYRAIESAWLLCFAFLIGAVVYGLVGCAPVGCIKPVVSIERPVLPEVQSSELESISADAYLRLRMRDVALHQYAETLEMTIRELAEVPDGN